jgi:hypothetical protein
MIGIEELQRGCGPARRESLRNRKHDAKDRGEAEHFDGLFHVEFSRIAPPPAERWPRKL